MPIELQESINGGMENFGMDEKQMDRDRQIFYDMNIVDTTNNLKILMDNPTASLKVQTLAEVMVSILTR